jgi:hypothetical protein
MDLKSIINRDLGQVGMNILLIIWVNIPPVEKLMALVRTQGLILFGKQFI